MLCVNKYGIHSKVVCCRKSSIVRIQFQKKSIVRIQEKILVVSNRKTINYPFLQHSCKFALRSGQAERLQADVVEEVSACSPHGSMIPSSHWPHGGQIELSGDMHL